MVHLDVRHIPHDLPFLDIASDYCTTFHVQATVERLKQIKLLNIKILRPWLLSVKSAKSPRREGINNGSEIQGLSKIRRLEGTVSEINVTIVLQI
jgi:hypothetical protein